MAGNAIRIAILANGSQARSELSRTAAAAENVGTKFSKFRLPAALALGAVAAGGKAAIDSASDLNEELSKSQQIFGKNAAAVEKFASTADTALGQSKRQALAAASNFGIIGDKAGLSGAETAKFATKFTGLASDLASFNNTTPEEAIVAIGAAMRGESEPIRKYGVLLDDATLRARALKMGIIDNVKTALTPQQKALAASEEILAQTTKAQGDFARTADGSANKSRILAAQAENVKAKLGKGLLPAYESVLKIMSKFATFASEHTGLVKGIVLAIAGLATVVLAASAAQRVYSAGLLVFNGIAATVKAVTMAWRAAQLALNIALYLNPIGVIVVAIVAFIAILVLAYKKVGFFRAGVQAAWAGIKAATVAVWNFIKALIGRVVGAIAAVIRFYFNTYKAIITGAWNAVKTATRAVWDGIKSAVRTAVGALTTIVRGIKGKVVGIFDGARKWLLDAGKKIIDGLIDGIGAMIGKLKDKLGGITDLIPKVKGPLDKDKRLLKPAGRGIMEGLIGGIESSIPDLRRTLGRVTDTVAGTQASMAGSLTLEASAAAGTLGTGSRAVAPIQINVTGALDPDAVARQIVQLLVRLARTLGVPVSQLFGRTA